MTFDQWWYDFRIKNGKRGKAEDIARAAWAEGAINAARELEAVKKNFQTYVAYHPDETKP